MGSTATGPIGRFVDRGERPFRGIGWGMLFSLPVWLGIALLFVR